MVIGRYYRLSKTITEEQAEQIVKELAAREDVKAVAFTDDRKMLRMESIDGEYKDIMYYAVNVLSREAGGCEISFDHFDTEALEKALEESIAGIGMRVGYSNPGKFSAAFQSVMNHTPSDYRKMITFYQ